MPLLQVDGRAGSTACTTTGAPFGGWWHGLVSQQLASCDPCGAHLSRHPSCILPEAVKPVCSPPRTNAHSPPRDAGEEDRLMLTVECQQGRKRMRMKRLDPFSKLFESFERVAREEVRWGLPLGMDAPNAPWTGVNHLGATGCIDGRRARACQPQALGPGPVSPVVSSGLARLWRFTLCF